MSSNEPRVDPATGEVLTEPLADFDWSAGHAELFAAVAAAQGEMKSVHRDAENTYHKSKYATLDAVWEEARPHLKANGLAVIQQAVGGGAEFLRIRTLLTHTSGQWLASTANVPLPKADPQGFGSAFTYARRYQLAAMLGMAVETDDDAQGAMPAAKPAARATTAKPAAQPPAQPQSMGEKAAALSEQQKAAKLAAALENAAGLAGYDTIGEAAEAAQGVDAKAVAAGDVPASRLLLAKLHELIRAQEEETPPLPPPPMVDVQAELPSDPFGDPVEGA
jgi:hypothetical protein